MTNEQSALLSTDNEFEPEKETDTLHDDEEATSLFDRMKVTTNLGLSTNEAIVEEYNHVKDAFVDHLQEANEGDDYFLSMALTKNLSMLPSKMEVVQAAEEFQDVVISLRRNFSSVPIRIPPEHPTTDVTQNEGSVPLSAYLTLLSAVVALSSIGPFLAKQKDVDATMKIVWRFQGTAVFLAPFAIHSVIINGWPRLSMAQWATFLCASASYSILCVAFAMSLNYTTVANATILTNSQSILLVGAKILMGQHVLYLEGFGVAVAFLGGVLCAKESAGLEGAPANGWLSLWGDALGLISSVGGIGYIILGKSLRSSMPVLFFMVLNMTTASFMILLFSWSIGTEFTWGRHVNHGVFGWMNLQGDRLPLELGTVFVCNLLGTMGYVRAFQHFSSITIAVASLLEPVVAALTAVLMGVGVLPGLEGWIGNVLVGAGTIAVLYPTTKQGIEEKNEENRVVRTPRTPYPRMQTPRTMYSRGVPMAALRKEQNTDRSLT